MNDLRRLHDICWIARRIENRQLGFRIEEYVSALSRDYIKAASKPPEPVTKPDTPVKRGRGRPPKEVKS